MNKSIDLKNDNIIKLFIHYFIPTVTGMAITALYVVVDGIFVGRGIGSDGLAAVNIVVPLFTIFSGIGLLFGEGGSTIASINLARGNVDKARRIFVQSLLLPSILIGILSTLGLIFEKELAYFLGTNDTIYPMVKDYMVIILIYGMSFAHNYILGSFLRVDKAPILPMIAMILGAIINLVLDYIFIFQWNLGVRGAALATGIGNLVGLAMMFEFFIRKRGTLHFVKVDIRWDEFMNICHLGFPIFIGNICLSITTMAYNIVFMKMLGADGVSAYSIINYIHPFMLMIFTGTAQAIQPIISYNHGIMLVDRTKETLKLAVKVALIMGVSFFVLAVIANKQMISLFLKSDASAFSIAVQGIPIYFSSYVVMGINVVIAAYFQSIEKSGIATILTLLRGLFFILGTLFFLPSMAGITGVWLTTPLAELMTFVLSIYYIKKNAGYNRNRLPKKQIKYQNEVSG